jgi:uncharacterized membrane protein YfcA
VSLIGFLAGLATGLVLSVLGAGGSMFIVPVLVFVLHSPVSEATGTSLAIVGAAALAAAIGHWRKGNIDPKVAMLFGGAAVAGAVAGAALHALVSARTLTALFAVVLFIGAARMIWGRPADPAVVRAPRAVILLPLGAAIGVLSGFLGVGGGFVIVPALSWGAGLSVRQAIGTSLVVIAVSSLAGAVSYAVQGQLSSGILVTVGAGAVLGALAGTPLSGKLPDRPLRLGFAALAVAVGIYMVVQVVRSAAVQ